MNEEEKAQTPKEQKKKYVFNCTKCGKCCEDRKEVPITTNDILKWSKNNLLQTIFPYVKLKVTQQQGSSLIIRPEQNKSGCPLYNTEDKLCTIYEHMPDICRAFPLNFNGNKYYIDPYNRQIDCPGIGHGTMSKEQLIEDRKAAEQAYINMNDSLLLTTLHYSLFMQHLQQEQQRIIEEMPEEERKKYEELLKSQQGTSGTDSEKE